MSGRNLLLAARTGSGKTLACIIPTLLHVAAQHPPDLGKGPVGLALVPTREHAQELVRVAGEFWRSGVTSVAGASALKVGSMTSAALMACTPREVLDMLVAAGADAPKLLERTTMLVVDEADCLLEMGCEADITRVASSIRPDRQTIISTSTLPPTVTPDVADVILVD